MIGGNMVVKRWNGAGFDVTFPNTTTYGPVIQNYRMKRPDNVNGVTVHTRNSDEENAIRGILAIAGACYLWKKQAEQDYRKGSIRVQRTDTTVREYPRLF